MHYRAHTVSTMSPSVHASTSSHTNMQYLNTPQKFKQYRGLKARCVAAEKKVKRLKESISKLITSSSIEVDNNLSHDLSMITKAKSLKIFQKIHSNVYFGTSKCNLFQ